MALGRSRGPFLEESKLQQVGKVQKLKLYDAPIKFVCHNFSNKAAFGEKNVFISWKLDLVFYRLL